MNFTLHSWLSGFVGSRQPNSSSPTPPKPHSSSRHVSPAVDCVQHGNPHRHVRTEPNCTMFPSAFRPAPVLPDHEPHSSCCSIDPPPPPPPPRLTLLLKSLPPLPSLAAPTPVVLVPVLGQHIQSRPPPLCRRHAAVSASVLCVSFRQHIHLHYSSPQPVLEPGPSACIRLGAWPVLLLSIVMRPAPSRLRRRRATVWQVLLLLIVPLPPPTPSRAAA